MMTRYAPIQPSEVAASVRLVVAATASYATRQLALPPFPIRWIRWDKAGALEAPIGIDGYTKHTSPPTVVLILKRAIPGARDEDSYVQTVLHEAAHVRAILDGWRQSEELATDFACSVSSDFINAIADQSRARAHEVEGRAFQAAWHAGQILIRTG